MYAIATIIVVLRLYAQFRVNGKLGWGDGLMVLALVSVAMDHQAKG